MTVEDGVPGARVASAGVITDRGPMLTPPTVTFKGIDSSTALDAEIRRQVGILETYNSSLIGCRVVVERSRHHQSGNHFHVGIDISLPGEEIVVTHEPTLLRTALAAEAEKVTKEIELDREHKHVFVAIRDAFDVAKRKLRSTTERHRGEVKTPSGRAPGRIVRLFPADGYGFLEAEDGREVYFHENSVSKGRFGRLKVGEPVLFAEEEGDKGPRATTVVPGA
jgi:cold shock CspA family protein/ribosome-associated translation inhibitor RaiA